MNEQWANSGSKFDVHGTVHRDIFPEKNQLDAQFSSLLNITLYDSKGLSFHHQELKTVHTASGIRHKGPLSASKQATNLYDIYLKLNA